VKRGTVVLLSRSMIRRLASFREQTLVVPRSREGERLHFARLTMPVAYANIQIDVGAAVSRKILQALAFPTDAALEIALSILVASKPWTPLATARDRIWQ